MPKLPTIEKKPKIQAYDYILTDLSNRQKQVFTCILENPDITIWDIGKKLKLPINSISGRLFELENKEVIKSNGYKYFKGHKQPQTKWILSK